MTPFAGALGVFTPYSTIYPFLDGTWDDSWAPESEQPRLAAYQKYEELYWNNPTAFRLQWRGVDVNPLYVPNARAVVDSTSHFLMKDFVLALETESDQSIFDAWAKREKFYYKFHTAKHSGVVRGDYVFHLTADPRKAPGKRVSIDSIDPSNYFPIFADDSADDVIGVDIVDVFMDSGRHPRVTRQRYLEVVQGNEMRISSELLLMEAEYWWDDDRAKIVDVLIPEKLLPRGIAAIPVYAFQNIGWQGQGFGSSELRGVERLLASVNQSVSDEEVALALEGLGVYATDAPHPTDSSGNELDWDIAPGVVLEVPSQSKFERVTGVGSIKPLQDHIAYLESALFEATGTFRPARVDIQVAQSGIALAIKFLPTLAKVSQREEAAKAVLQQMMFDWGFWQVAYENETWAGGSVDVEIALGEKLPKDPTDLLNELNNMLDRGVISAQYYREMMTQELGYVFPDDIDTQVTAEKMAAFKLAQQFAPQVSDGTGDGGGPSDSSGTKNRANNKSKPNESSGTEAN